MENIETMKEEIAVGVEPVTLQIPVRVTMTSFNDAAFDFTMSIDEVGQIILTPVSKDVEFIDANTDTNVDYEVPIIEQQTLTTTDGSITTQETTIVLQANMLAESDNHDVSAVVDEIGQVVIYPAQTNNSFVTVTRNDSLNLVTEDAKTIEYFGYKLVNTGDGWNIYDYNNTLIEEGVATLAEAKIVACTTEIHLLEKLTEDLDTHNEEDNSKQSPTEEDENSNIPEVEAEVVEESNSTKTIPMLIEELTSAFQEEEGALRCDTEEELTACLETLTSRYSLIESVSDSEGFYLSYKNPIIAESI